MKLDRKDRILINAVQHGFPVVPGPFEKIGMAVGMEESEVITRLERLVREKYIRYIGAIINTGLLGFHSTLVAFRIKPPGIPRAVKIINSHPGVSHNYERNHKFNIWFTICTPGDIDLKKTVKQIEILTGAEEMLFLPAIKTFKLRVRLDADHPDESRHDADRHNGGSIMETDESYRTTVHHKTGSAAPLTPLQVRVVKSIQKGIPLAPDPYEKISSDLGLETETLLEIIRGLMARGIIRRFGMVPHHRKLGYTHNVMAVWEVPEERIDECGWAISSLKAVSHCYQRPTAPGWPYNLFSMIHARSRGEADILLKTIIEKTGPKKYELLLSIKEHKKKRLDYFTDEFYTWDRKYVPTE